MSKIARKPWVHLSDEEKILWVSNPSIFPYLPHFSAAILVMAVGIWSNFFLTNIEIAGVSINLSSQIPGKISLAIILVGASYLLYMYLKRRCTHYVITSKHLYSKRGILTVDPKHTKVGNVQNIDRYQGIIQRILKYGSVNIETAGTGTIDMRLNNVPKLNKFTRVLNHQSASRVEGESNDNQSAM